MTAVPAPRPSASGAPAPQPLRPVDEAERARRLRAMKRWALALLALATVTFVVARFLEARHPGLAIVRATAEAAMIGGLADWFAVTALFRHPLGLPIPHTAIIPRRKDRVGETLGLFVQRNFLHRDVLAARLQALRVAERVARWLAQPAHAQGVARQVARVLAASAQALRDDAVQGLIAGAVEQRVRATPVAPLLGRLLALLTAGNRHQALLDDAIRLLATGISEHQDLIRARVEEESPWWVPGAIDERIAQRIVGALERTMQAVHADPAHPLRARFDAALDRFVVALQASPEVIQRAEHIKAEVLDAEAVRQFSAAMWRDAKGALARLAEGDEAARSEAIERAVVAFAQGALDDPALLARVDAWVAEAIVALAERHQDEVGALIATTVRGWDAEATSRRIELAIGRDLQFIRINGTLVGGLAGLLLHLVQRAF